jgi:hypothetical protein
MCVYALPSPQKTNECKAGETWVRFGVGWVSLSLLWNHVIILQNAKIEGTWVKGVWDPSDHFYMWLYE